MRRRHDSVDRGFGLAFEIRILFARVNLLLENLWREGFFLFLAAGIFVGLSWLDFWSLTGGILHLAFLILFGGGLLYALFKLVKGFRAPTRDRALRYLELRNALAHRPLQSMGAESEAEKKNNTPASAMWQIYQKSLRKNLIGLKIGIPNLDMGAGDGYGLRAVAVLILAAGFIVAGPQATERFVAAFTPQIGAPAIPLDMTAWITPPEYTGQAPILLKMQTSSANEGPPRAYTIPAGSRFIARVFGGNSEPPVLKKGPESLAFERLDAKNYEIETGFDQPVLMQIDKGGDVVGAWQLNVVADNAPSINLLIQPEVTERSAFRLQYRALDDYGVAGIGAEITRENSDKKISLSLPTPGRGSTEIVGQSYHDLTAHPWAGLEVKLTLMAEDQNGQRGVSDVTTMILPEKIFTHPISKALIEQRRHLVEDPVGNKPTVQIALEAIALIPESLDDDFTAIMLLSMARSNLRNSDEQSAIDEVISILWETALRLENGDLSMAEAALREAEQALMEALNNGASDEEITRLMDELRAAMENFLAALAQQSDTAERPMLDPDSQNQIIQSQDLQNLLDKIDELSKNGARDAARELLSELQDIMENLQSAQGMGPTAEQRAMQGMLNELGELMQKQQQLLDDTLRESQKGEPGQPGQQGGQQPQGAPQPGKPGQSGQQGGLQGLAQDQDALRQMLEDLLGRLGAQGDIPKELGRAGKNMKDAGNALGEGQGEGAMQSENKALENLRAGAQSLAEEMMQGQGQGAQSAGTNQRRPGRDPLGRALEEGPIGSEAGGKLRAGANSFNKTRSIRDEVQRRLSDPSRNLLEREYLKRLLDFF